MLVVIGSRALSYHSKTIRFPKDFDVIGSYDEVMEHFGEYPIIYPVNKGKTLIFKKGNKAPTFYTDIVEAEITWPDSGTEKLFNMIQDDPRTLRDGVCLIPSLDVLYMIKMSHRYLKDSPHFLKTMRDIQAMRKMGAVIPEEYKEMYKRRMIDTYWYKHPNLNMSKKEFFTDTVPYKYDHDDIHRSVAHREKPAHEYYKVENEEVLCSKDKFYEVEAEVRLYGVLEEAYVLALERHQIPNDFSPDMKDSFRIALMKVCTSITSGWFREYAWEHYDEVCDLFCKDFDYVIAFQKALKRGKIKPYAVEV